MKVGRHDTDQQVLVVAEVGNNHEGDLELAKELIHRASDAGADVVKFQTFKTELFVSPKNKVRFEKLKQFELSFDDFSQLHAVAEAAGITFMSTPLDLESAAFLSDVVPAFKVASGDNNFVPLLKQIASSDKSVILSTGLMTVDEIQGAMETIRTCWKEHGFEQDLAVLHCISAYPAEPASTNLAAIATLRDALDCTVGYSDHTLGCDAAVLSVALGARIVEKHFTIDHQHSDFRDHQLSADPAELKDLVERIRQAEVLMGSGEKKPCQQEADIMPQIRRSIVAAHDLSAGTVLSLKDLCWIRPFDGLAPGNEDRVIGKALDRDIQAGDPITEDMLK